MRRLVALVLAVGLLGVVASPAAAASPRAGTIAHRVSIHVVAHRAPSRMIDILAAVPVVNNCYYAYWTAQAVNITNTVLFQYKEQVEWCSNGKKITSASRWTAPTTPRPWLWQYQSETLFDASYSVGSTSVTYRARGLFNQVVPTIFGFMVVGQSHPLVGITANANGTAFGSISW